MMARDRNAIRVKTGPKPADWKNARRTMAIAIRIQMIVILADESETIPQLLTHSRRRWRVDTLDSGLWLWDFILFVSRRLAGLKFNHA
jgi:hypothetical protein